MILAATSIFIVAYILIASEKVSRMTVVSVGAALMFLIGATTTDSAFYSHETGVDWNVIFLLLGMMIIVSIIHKTGLFEYLAIKSIKLVKGDVKLGFVVILLLVAFASALLDNVTTVMLAVPMTFLIAKYLNVNPVPFILGEIFVSNIGGAATLIGDPPNIIIGSKVGLTFNQFLVNMGPIVLLVLLFVIPLLVFMFRKDLVNSQTDRDAVLNLVPNEFISDRSLLKKSIFVLSAVVIAFVLHSVVHLEPAVVAMIGAGVLVFISKVKPADFTRDIEWETLIFFAGLFIMVGALVEVGALQIAADFLSDLTGGQASVAATLLVTASALISGVVDNIPYVTSMIPVVEVMEKSIPSITNDGLWWALALGADFGGNLTIVGASANVVATGLAYANGHKITFGQFFKYGLPVTFVSIALALPYVLIRYF